MMILDLYLYSDRNLGSLDEFQMPNPISTSWGKVSHSRRLGPQLLSNWQFHNLCFPFSHLGLESLDQEPPIMFHKKSLYSFIFIINLWLLSYQPMVHKTMALAVGHVILFPSITLNSILYVPSYPFNRIFIG